MPKEKFKGFTTCSQVSSGLSRLQRITRDEALSLEVMRAFMKAKTQFNIGRALMKHELEKNRLAKADLMYGFLYTGAGGAASDSPMGSEEAGEQDHLSQNSAGSANSYYSGPTQKMGEDKPPAAEKVQA